MGTKFMQSALGAGVLAGLLMVSAGVRAEGGPQNHHCKMPDGTVDTSKTHKECKAAKGAWTKDANAAGKPEDNKEKSDEHKDKPGEHGEHGEHGEKPGEHKEGHGPKSGH